MVVEARIAVGASPARAGVIVPRSVMAAPVEPLTATDGKAVAPQGLSTSDEGGCVDIVIDVCAEMSSRLGPQLGLHGIEYVSSPPPGEGIEYLHVGKGMSLSGVKELQVFVGHDTYEHCPASGLSWVERVGGYVGAVPLWLHSLDTKRRMHPYVSQVPSLSEAEVTMLGGLEQAEEWSRAHYEAGIRSWRDYDATDWDRVACELAEVINRSLEKGGRAHE